MKKNLLIVLCAALVLSVVAALAQEVLSANTIGYIKRSLPAQGKLITVSVPLNNMTAANNVFSNLSLASEVPFGAVAYFWNPVAQKWDPGTKKVKGGWDPNVNTQIVASGDFFFIKGPATSTVPTEVTIAGEVPDVATLTRAIPGGNALGSMANPYPADFVFGTSSLASNASNGSVAYLWDPAAQKWNPGTKKVKGGWDPNVLTAKVAATEGFFLKEFSTATIWTNAKPYTWP